MEKDAPLENDDVIVEMSEPDVKGRPSSEKKDVIEEEPMNEKKPLKSNSIHQSKGDYEYITFFINPKSGKLEGEKALKLSASEIKTEKKTKVTLFNLIDKEQFDKGVEELKTELSQDKLAKVVICGGDGTVLSLIDSLIEAEVQTERCRFCVLPFGTGNDLANCLGWGSNGLIRDYFPEKSRSTGQIGCGSSGSYLNSSGYLGFGSKNR